jgi:hypothetical protein
MREILFRGQTRKYGEKVRVGDGQKLPGQWVYGGVLQGVGSHSIIYGGENVNDPGENLDKWCVHTDTLGQFTGKTDKNGKKVFENDIVVICYEADGEEFSETKRVHYNEKECCWYPMRWEECCEHCDHYTEVKSIEVIGNIHDNPELLENS